MAKHAVATFQQEAEFRGRANMPWIWQMQAHILISAANVLWNRYNARSRARFPATPRQRQIRWFAGEVQPWPAMMLDGFAIENLLKGLLLAEGAQATQGGRIDRSIRTHNLTALCTRAHITLDQREEELLERVKRMMELGRYPVGANATMDVALRLELPRDRNTITTLLERIDGAFKQAARTSVDDDLTKLGVRLIRISGHESLRRIAMLHGDRLDGSRI